MSDLMFPVQERTMDLKPLPAQQVLGQRVDSDLDHKVLIRTDTGEIIAIVPLSYHLITNEDIIGQFYAELRDREIPAFIDDTNSFADNHRMTVQTTLPEVNFQVDDSQIGLSIFVSNSYVGDGGIRVVFGAVEFKSGFTMYLSSTLHEVTIPRRKDVDLSRKVEDAVSYALALWPSVEEKIHKLGKTPLAPDFYEQIEGIFGETWEARIRKKKPATMWQAHSILSSFVSLEFKKEERGRLYTIVSTLFDL